MLKFPVSPTKQKELFERMEKLVINESDLLEKFVRGSGSGGQKINKTSSTVYLKHIPSGLEVKCQESRQLSLNRYYARKLLCDIIEEQVLGVESRRQRLVSKLRRQKAKRSKRAKVKLLADKRHKSNVKSSRKKPSGDD